MKFLLLATLAAVVATTAPSVAQTKTSNGSGNWGTIDWTPAGVPAAAAQVLIANGNEVEYTSTSYVTPPNFGRVWVGGGTGNEGTLTVSSGTLTVNANVPEAYSVGREAGSTGVLNVTGGTLRGIGTSTSGTAMVVGQGQDSEGELNVSGNGVLTLSGTILLGGYDQGGNTNTSTGRMTVSGNASVTIASGVSPSPRPVFVGVRVNDKTSVGIYEQTGGTVTIGTTFLIGNASDPSQNMQATAEITGGTFTADVAVGRSGVVTSGGGSGTLTIGPEANVFGKSAAWQVSGSGKIVFELGTTPAFNAVDLTSVTAGTALTFSQLGATISVDSSLLAFAEDYSPITLIEWANGKIPTTIGNVVFDPVGFDDRFVPELDWTATGLQLTLGVVPEPSTVALMVGAAVMGVVVARYRRRR